MHQECRHSSDAILINPASVHQKHIHRAHSPLQKLTQLDYNNNRINQKRAWEIPAAPMPSFIYTIDIDRCTHWSGRPRLVARYFLWALSAVFMTRISLGEVVVFTSPLNREHRMNTDTDSQRKIATW